MEYSISFNYVFLSYWILEIFFQIFFFLVIFQKLQYQPKYRVNACFLFLRGIVKQEYGLDHGQFYSVVSIFRREDFIWLYTRETKFLYNSRITFKNKLNLLNCSTSKDNPDMGQILYNRPFGKKIKRVLFYFLTKDMIKPCRFFKKKRKAS